ncbi:MAG: type II secretion system protein GspC [Halioglobus sp.]|nr:type II secretion system protein GspC [Halioglobus sp.]
MSAGLTTALATLSQPDNARRLRQLVLVVLAIWAVTALASLVWALLPDPPPVATPTAVINPVATASAGQSGAENIDIARMKDWHLFGEAGAEPVAPVTPPEVLAADNARDGIEKGARQTRLKLALRGIVASTEDGLGHAIIEYQSRQDVYAVEDKLPVPGRVTLAKVMPQQVVINNGGTYELLKLFDKSALASQVPAPRPRPEPAAKAEDLDKRGDLDATRLAAGYRKRLYQDPQSLAEVVGVSAVREAGQLVGYRVSPGQDREQFEQLGFQAGDLVQSVNGIDLSSPANTMRLYNLMRTAGEAVFEVQRKGQPVTLSVSLDEAGQQ